MLSLDRYYYVITLLSILCLSGSTGLGLSVLATNSQSSTTEAESITTPPQSSYPSLTDPSLKVEKVADGLFLPTSISFLGDNDFIILQKNGTVSRIVNGTLLDRPLLNLEVASGFYQGLLGSAVSKNVEANTTYVFLYYTQLNPNNMSDGESTINSVNSSSKFLGHKVYRYELVDGKLTNPKLLLELPSTPGPENNGGHITIGPDNNLFIIIGNVMNPSNETEVQTLTQNFVNGSPPDGRSGILHITQDGEPIPNKNNTNNETRGILGNNYPLNLYYAYGIHNGFGLAFDPITGHLWDTETGHYIYNDEINLVMPGFNSGYGVVQGMSAFFPNSPYSMVSFNGSGKYSDPEFTWVQKAVPTGLAFVTSDKLGSTYQNDLLVGTFNAGKIYHFDLTEDRTHLVLPPSLQPKILLTLNSTGADEIEFGSGFGGISSIAISPEGYLYVVGVVNGAVYKISPR